MLPWSDRLAWGRAARLVAYQLGPHHPSGGGARWTVGIVVWWWWRRPCASCIMMTTAEYRDFVCRSYALLLLLQQAPGVVGGINPIARERLRSKRPLLRLPAPFVSAAPRRCPADGTPAGGGAVRCAMAGCLSVHSTRAVLNVPSPGRCSPLLSALARARSGACCAVRPPHWLSRHCDGSAHCCARLADRPCRHRRLPRHRHNPVVRAPADSEAES